MPSAPFFAPSFRDELRLLFRWRRDVRRFRPEPLPEGALDELLAIVATAPSVGLSQPWRFVLVEDETRRAAVRGIFERCNAEALAAQRRERRTLYAKLKLAGLEEAPVHLAVFVEPDPKQGFGLGRHSMPETAAYSAVLAIHTLWLAARADGLGLGWVSILDPHALGEALAVPRDWIFIGYLCLGYPHEESDVPELEREGWETRQPAAATLLLR